MNVRSPSRSDLLVGAGLTAIVILAGVLRFYNLPFRGFVYWDEAKFALEGIRISAGLQSLFGGHVYDLAGKSIGTAKPTHALFFALAYLIFGVHDYVALGVNAFAGCLSVILIFFVARRLFGTSVALLAALLLAVSEYDIIYARSALSESDATFLFLAALTIWLWKSFEKRRELIYDSHGISAPVLSGLLLGLAFTTNYRVIVYAGLLVLADLYLAWRIDLNGTVSRLFAWIAGFMVFPLTWQVVDLITHASGLTLFGDELGGGWRSYLSQVVYQLHEGKQSSFNFRPLPYIQWFDVRQGWWQLALLAVGLALAFLRRHEPAWYIPGLFVIVPYLVYIFAPFTVPRSLVTALPFVMILIAAALSRLSVGAVRLLRASRYGYRYVLLPGVAAALILAGLSGAMSWRLTAERSGFVQAVRYVESRTSHAMTSSEIVLFYMRGSGPTCNAPALPLSPGGLATYVRDGYTLAILERHHSSQIAHFVRTRAIRVGHFPALGPLEIGEDLISSENSNPPANDYRTEYVDVYRFAHVPAKPDPRTVVVCTRDHVT